MKKIDKMIDYLRTMEIQIADDIIETLEAARTMVESVGIVRIVGKTIVEVRNEEAFISAAKDFSDLTGVYGLPKAEDTE